MILSLLATALGIWGYLYPGQVQVQVTSNIPAGTLAYAYPGVPDGGATWVWTNNRWYFVASRTPCIIKISPNWTTWPSWMQQDVMTHEVGHCGGLQHSTDVYDIMYPARASYQRHAPTTAQRIQFEQNMGVYR
jgi:hypothetical protein